jgi:hypothetical protein
MIEFNQKMDESTYQMAGRQSTNAVHGADGEKFAEGEKTKTQTGSTKEVD